MAANFNQSHCLSGEVPPASPLPPPAAPPEQPASINPSSSVAAEALSLLKRRQAARDFFTEFAGIVGKGLATVQAIRAFGADPRIYTPREIAEDVLPAYELVWSEKHIQRLANRAGALGLPQAVWFTRRRYDFVCVGPYPRGVLCILNVSSYGLSVARVVGLSPNGDFSDKATGAFGVEGTYILEKGGCNRDECNPSVSGPIS